MVVLRKVTAADGPALVRLARQSRRFHAELVSPPRTAEEFDQYLARASGADFVALVLIGEDDGAPVGAVNLSQIFRGPFQNAYLGYWIGAPFARRGYMAAGLSGAVDYAFGELRLHRLEANIQPANDASRGLVEKLGFRLEGYSPRYLKIAGRWRDHERWAILREEWRGGRPIPRMPRRSPEDTDPLAPGGYESHGTRAASAARPEPPREIAS